MLSRTVLAVAVASLFVADVSGGADVPTSRPRVGCPSAVPCTTGGPSCWAVNVKFTVNDAPGGAPDYQTHDWWVDGHAFELRADAECAAARLARRGVWWSQVATPELGTFIPPARIDAVTIHDLYARPEAAK